MAENPFKLDVSGKKMWLQQRCRWLRCQRRVKFGTHDVTTPIVNKAAQAAFKRLNIKLYYRAEMTGVARPWLKY